MGVGKHRNNGTVRRNPGEGMEQQYHVHKEYRYDAQPDISSALLKAPAPGQCSPWAPRPGSPLPEGPAALARPVPGGLGPAVP